MIRRPFRVTVRFTSEEFDRYKQFLHTYPTYTWTALVHKALFDYHEKLCPTRPASSDKRSRVRRSVRRRKAVKHGT